MRRVLKYFAESIAALVAIGIVLAVLAVWRLATNPVEAKVMTPYVEAGLSRLLPGTFAQIDSTLLVWDNNNHSIALQADRVVLRDVNRSVMATLPSVKVRFGIFSLLRGTLIPESLEIQQPSLYFERDLDGRIKFGGFGAGKESESGSNEAPSNGSSAREAVSHLVDSLVNQGALESLGVSQAHLKIHDLTSNEIWIATASSVRLARIRTGLEGQVEVEIKQDENATQIRGRYRFNEDEKKHLVTLRIVGVNPSLYMAGFQTATGAVLRGIDVPLTGEINATLDEGLMPLSASVHVNAGSGRLIFPDLWEEPRAVKSAVLHISYDQDKLHIGDSFIDFDGPKLTIAADGAAPEEDDFDLAFTSTIGLNGLPMDQFASVWPKPAVPGARSWISENMSRGEFTQGSVLLRGKLKWNDLANLVLESGEGKISAKNGTLRYLEGAPPIEGVDADATFDLDHMDVAVSGGAVGDLKLQPSVVHLTDFQQSVQHISIPLNIAGSVKDAWRIIDSPPLGYGKAVGLKQEDVDGRLEGVVDIRLPLLLDVFLKDVAITARAKFANFSARNLVPGFLLSEGGFDLNLDQNGFTIKGPVAFNKVPMQVAWQGVFTPSEENSRYQATLTGTINGSQWASLGVEQLGKMEGTSAATIQYTQSRDKVSRLTGDVDFRQSGIDLRDLNWKKPVGTATALSFMAHQSPGKDLQIEKINLQGAKTRVVGSATVDAASGAVLSLNLKPFVIGRTNAAVKFSQSSDKKTQRLSVEGGSLDLSGLSTKDEEAVESHSKQYSVNLNKLWMSADGFLSGLTFHAERDKIGWSEMELHAMAGGEHPLDISLKPLQGEPGKRTFSIKSDDFGATMKGLGFTDTIRGGSLEVTGRSNATEHRLIEGKVKIGSFTVSGLPLLARLLSAASPFGFADLVTGHTSFDRLEGGFRWQGDTIDFQQIRAAGSVYGVNVNGQLRLKDNTANLYGTLVPFSFFNRVINAIPLVGGIITGGEGEGVIAAAYTVTGSLNDPQISVNPASLLTPGFLRSLFFSGDAAEPEEEQQEKPQSEKPKVEEKQIKKAP